MNILISWFTDTLKVIPYSIHIAFRFVVNIDKLTDGLIINIKNIYIPNIRELETLGQG